MSILDKIDKEIDRLDEAADIDLKELPADRMGLLKHLGIKDKDVENTQQGIHGYTVDLTGQYGVAGFRVDKKDFNKFKNKNIRWIEVKAIGF